MSVWDDFVEFVVAVAAFILVGLVAVFGALAFVMVWILAIIQTFPIGSLVVGGLLLWIAL